MGTRGTLRIYVNGELKVRQYNQWDSYPTGQFDTLCKALSSRYVLVNLTNRLLNTRLATKAEMARLRERKDPQNIGEEWTYALLDRDIGSDLLHILAGAPNACEVLPDWCHIFEYDESDELADEEGNYVIHIECECPFSPFSKRAKSDSIRFKLSGDWHGAVKDFEWNYIPTNEEIKSWEEEPHED